ncbi:MAG: ABC transporter ATP-binding protein [Thermoleophilia bacterium]|nr:ABC transporter ATP-binding protein [Thermoleophilia bacterium]
MLEVKDLWCHYGGAEILKGVSLRVDEGKVVAIIGSNGAGKTTTMRCISGLKAPTSGTIEFLGQRIDGKSPQEIVRLGVVQVPEGRQLFPYLTVMENLKVGAYLRKDRAQMKADMERVFEHFPRLYERRRQKARTLSGGEQQMLAIGRALMANPKLLLLDEPSLGLSPLMVEEIRKIVENINTTRGIGVVLVEQNARLALGVAHYAYVLETGSVVLEGSPEELMTSDHVRRAYLGQ